MDSLFREHSKKIRIYLAKETQEDPFEQNTSRTYFNPIAIDAIVTDLTPTQINWKIPGIKTSRAKEIIVCKRCKSLLENSAKIEVDNVMYEGWRDNGRMQIREEGNFLRLYIYSKHDD